MPASTDVSSAIVRSFIPARMDRLPWTRFHTRLVMSLGTAWILDGLEITLASSVAVYPGTIPYIRAVRGKGLPTTVVSSTNTTVNGTDIAVKDVADLLDGTGQPDRNAR